MLTIVFYYSAGKAAKLRGREIAARKPNAARIYHAPAWDGRHDYCDAVEIMPDVPDWQQARIVAVFGSKLVLTPGLGGIASPADPLAKSELVADATELVAVEPVAKVTEPAKATAEQAPDQTAAPSQQADVGEQAELAVSSEQTPRRSRGSYARSASA